MKFGSFYYWNREKTPSQQDPPQQALKWLGLAQRLHSPINREMMELEKNKMQQDIDQTKSSNDVVDAAQTSATSLTTGQSNDDDVTGNNEAESLDEELKDDRPLKKLKMDPDVV
ncbi:hypothetical protein SAMD00019534_022190 [Acytostelium subglobosum LB1]|uniref:hypothetical protein n=1 Tax=Acytostelium subglobosum LB1 TaxID=1410327 RepID=UPI000644B78E|nr:hypothetical protein SAMD00019534_022190 [Acytostelium subglobosum LB1]GAM19044.1 hypothetical protein SAMD00019534_022190 [Acytostelium subglobosum LB1]|eukprot:XP_012756971.1 hypothetical protein SAMD00019534_022190 [Acytostelium subglobosum LB1]